MSNPEDIPKRYKDLSPDLWPRRVYSGGAAILPFPSETGVPGVISVPGVAGVTGVAGVRDNPPPYLGNGIYVGRGLLGYPVTVGTTPVKIIDSPYAWPYMVLNPLTSLGITGFYTGFSGIANAAGNSQSSSIGVTGYMGAHLYLTVTAITGTWNFTAQSIDPINLNWVDTQNLWTGVNAATIQYAFVGNQGIVTDIAFGWVPTAPGSITFSIVVVLKGGPGGAEGVANAVFIGNESVTTVAGFPILPGTKETFIMSENMTLWGVATTNTTIRVFIL